MDPIEELGGFLDNDQFVSFRWLAIFLDISVEKSKKILEDYKSSNNDVTATYCLSGQLRNKHRCVTVVSEKNLMRSREFFEIINDTHIYSLQKKKIAESSNLPMQLHAADVQQATEQVFMQNNPVSFLLNSIGGVRLNGNEVRPIGKRAAAPIRVIAASARDSAPTAAQTGVMKAFSAANGKSKEKTNPTASVSSSSSAKETSRDKSKSVASNFFANSTAASDNSKAAKSAKSEVAPSKSKSMIASSTKDEDDNDEWTEDGAESYKLDKNKLKNRGVQNSSSPPHIEQQPISIALPEDIEETSVATATSDKRKAPLHVHGAMDDYMEDVAIEQYKADQAAGVSESSESAGIVGKRKKRKLVEKVSEDYFVTVEMHSPNPLFSSPVPSLHQMFGDAKGYLITEMVWEEVTDDDEPQSKPVSRSSDPGPKVGITKEKRPMDDEEDEEKDSSDKKSKTTAKAAVTKKAKKAAPATQQKGMMSFFGKK
jgi:DNA polymerase subunit Cdc27